VRVRVPCHQGGIVNEQQHRLISRHFGAGRSPGDVIADRFVSVFGSWSYIIWQTVVIVAWMLGNAWFLKQWGADIGLRRVPDPYPFILLNLMFSAQASYAAPLILMAQNRGARRDQDFARHQFEIIERTDGNAGELLNLQRQQMSVLAGIDRLGEQVAALAAQGAAPAQPAPAVGTPPKAPPRRGAPPPAGNGETKQRM
jgi:uncharacterized membrane protein